MIGVYYFSGAGHSRTIAEYLAEMLNTEAVRIEKNNCGREQCSVSAVVFPVYCQNIPEPVKTFLRGVRSEYAAVVAAYGGISPGNVLSDAGDLLSCPMTAAACVPTGHSLLGEGCDFDKSSLDPVIEKILAPSPVEIPKMKKSFWADMFPSLRSRIGTKIIKNPSCDGCGRCAEVCPVGADCGKCIRCLRCVAECPNKALTHKNRYVLQRYLRNNRNPKTVIIV